MYMQSKYSMCVCAQSASHVQLFPTPQAHLFIRFSQQEYWSRLSSLLPRDLPDSEIEPASPASSVLQANSSLLSHWGSPNILHYKEKYLSGHCRYFTKTVNIIDMCVLSGSFVSNSLQLHKL